VDARTRHPGGRDPGPRPEPEGACGPPSRTAVILAAGNGDRLSGEAPVKPLLEVGGLTLIERTILTLQRAGVREFRVVVGAKSDRLVAAVRAAKRLRGLDITFIECPDWQLGNGVSLARGAAAVEGPFLASMSDHVTDGASARALVAASAARPDTPKLATDPHPGGVFDLADATKVRTEDGRIEAIGKDLARFDQVDTGLFYFPAGAGPRLDALREAGAREVSDLVRALAADDEHGGFEVVPVAGGVWQDVDTPQMAREAERRLLRSLVKETDGPVSRHLNRPISLRLTRILARLGVSPNAVTTFVFVLSIAAALVAARASSYAALALGGVLFHVASIVDGCDGELARYTLKGSRFGTWYDSITDNVRYAAIFAALGVHSYRDTGLPLYLWAVGLFVLVAVYLVSMMARKLLAEGAPGTHLVIVAETAAFATGPAAGWFERVAWPLRPLVKQDVIALVVMVGALLGQPAATFWVGLAGLLVMTIQVRRALHPAELASGGPLRQGQNGSFAMFLIGTAILALMLSRVPVTDVTRALSGVGLGALLLLAIPLVWILLNTLSLAALVDHEVRLVSLLRNRLVGEAINTLVPLAGVAGEPYKIMHLSTFVPLDRATQAVVSDKVINTLAGLVFFTAAGSLSVALVELPPSLAAGMVTLVVVAALCAVGLSAMVLSGLQGRLLVPVMRRLGVAVEDRRPPLRPRTFLVALAYNVAGRLAGLLEVVALLHLLGVSVDAVHVVAVAAVLSATSILFFAIPQGIGVSEAGVAGAFLVLGLPVHVGVAFALLRRGRMVFWALVGLAVHLLHGLLTRIRAQVELEPTR
jgi:CDP-L-myo-inositol myo-inositolphosphotransferase